MGKINSLKDVVERNLCIGCGACYFACKKQGIELVNFENEGIRPVFRDEECEGCTDCLSVCPGDSLDAAEKDRALPPEAVKSDLFGATLGIYEGYASDRDIRHHGSSGGILTALALYCLEQEEMAFVLHTGMDETMPWLNSTIRSSTREQLIRSAGSRYATSSPCDSLHLIEESDRPCVFIGKPCDVAAVQKLRKQRPELDKKLGLVLSFVCAGTPSTHGTLELMDDFGVDRGQVDSVRYRGEGWPGNFRVKLKNSDEKPSMTYKDSWSRMQRYRPLRCHLCPDSLGEFSDITSGDAWNRYDPEVENEGLSLILIRSVRGRELFEKACGAGYITATPADAEQVVKAQGVISKRQELFGRLLGMKLLGLPAPRYRGFHLFRTWMRIPFSRKVKSVFGTVRRIIRKGYWKRKRYQVPETVRKPEVPGA